MKKFVIILSLIVCVSNIQAQYKYDPCFYEILGILDEYNGRFISSEDMRKNLVETFYPHEEKLAENVQELIARIEKKSKTNYLVEKKIGKQRHIDFYSAKLCSEINTLYQAGSYNLISLKPEVVLEAKPEQKIAYIKGAYARFGGENRILMYNAPHKIDLIAAVLKQLNCHNIVIYHTEECIPNRFAVTFEPDKRLKAELKEFKANSSFNKDNYTIVKKVN